MNKRIRHFLHFSIVIFLIECTITTSIAGSTSLTVEQRITERDFPSVFQAWNPADNLPSENRLDTLARHDLVWSVAEFYGLQWDASEYKGMAEIFRPDSISNALTFRKNVLSRNPHVIFAVEIRYRDAPNNFLPANSDWWMRDENGNRIPGWAEGGHYILNYPDIGFQVHVAARCKAAMDTGVLDGILLDWWDDNDVSRLSLIQNIRKVIGYEPLIIVNSNDRKIPNTAEYVNGLFMEVYDTSGVKNWEKAADTLLWAEEHLLAPRVNCLETWFHTSRQDLNLMRATTALSLTHSNGYCLFSDPNPLPVPDHLHDWYSFWNKEVIRPRRLKLGKPVALRVVHPNRLITRQFEYGMVAYNRADNTELILSFTEPVQSVATGIIAREHLLDNLDGDIYVAVSSGSVELIEESIVAGFETGDFRRFTWEFSGDADWVVTSGQSNSGTYSARAGSIGNGEQSCLRVEFDCFSGDVSFYYKVSSESGYDYLRFYIDGDERGAWSGEEDWRQVSFPIGAGPRTLRWEYSKDGSVSHGDDTAWIDDIVFPRQ